MYVNLPFNGRVVLINELLGEREELLFSADVLRPPHLLRRVHDGAHTDALTAPRFLDGKERFGLPLGSAQVWQVLGCRPAWDIHGGVDLAFNSPGGCLEHQLQITVGCGLQPRQGTISSILRF